MEVVNASVWREEVDGKVQEKGLSSHVSGWVEERGPGEIVTHCYH